MSKPIDIPIQRPGATYSDMIRVNARHYRALCRLADEGGYTSLGQLLGVILDAAMPRIKLVERPRYELAIVDEADQTE